MTRRFQEKYTQLLRSYFLNPEEALLEEAYRLGKELVATRCDIEDIGEMHTLAMKQLAQELPDSSIGDERGHIPLLEVLVAYGVTLRTQAEWLERQAQTLEGEIAERERAEEQISRLLDQQVAVNEISLLLGSTLDLSAICQIAHQQVEKLVDCPNFAIFLYDDANQEISPLLIIGDGQPIDTRNLPKAPLEPGTGPQSRAIVTRQPDIVTDLVEQLPRIKTHISVPTQDRRQARSVLTVPMIIGERVIGTMQMQSYEVGVYTPSEAQLLSGIANQVALAIQNADLYAKAQQELAERRRAEEALTEYSERLEEMVEERTQALRDAQEQLIRQEKLATLGQLADAMAHELRNPLGAISNAAYFLNLILEEPAPGVKETLEVLDREVRTSEQIISSLLDFARTRPPVRQTVNVNVLVLDALSRAGVPASIQVTTDLDETLPTIQADPDQLEQVFDNLIRNAVQAMPAGGQLSVISEQLSVNSDQSPVSNLQSPVSNLQSPISISFTDTGMGIPPENLDKLFEPLFTTKAKGIGLGLALCKMLVEGHGGCIEVHSEVGKGSAFAVRLPMAAEVDQR